MGISVCAPLDLAADNLEACFALSDLHSDHAAPTSLPVSPPAQELEELREWPSHLSLSPLLKTAFALEAT